MNGDLLKIDAEYKGGEQHEIHHDRRRVQREIGHEELVMIPPEHRYQYEREAKRVEARPHRREFCNALGNYKAEPDFGQAETDDDVGKGFETMDRPLVGCGQIITPGRL